MGLEGKGPTIVGVLWFEVVLCFMTIVLRLYTRTIIRSSVGWDDLLLVFTWVFMVGFVGLCTGAVHSGMGVHADQLTPDQMAHGMLLLLSGQTVISFAMGTSKWAVAAFLMRIVVKKWHKAFLWFWITTIMFLATFQGIVVFTQCTPAKAIWDARVPKKSCSMNLVPVTIVVGSWSAALDIVLALFPWLALWNLNMKPREKISICSSLSLGIFAGICGIIRTTGLEALSVSADYLYATSESVMWTNSEITTTMVCISVPALRPLYRFLRGTESTNENSNYNSLPPYAKYSSSAGRSRSGKNTHNDDLDLDTLVTTTPQADEQSPDVMKASTTNSIQALKGNNRGSGVGVGVGDSDTGGILPSHIYQVNEVSVSYEDGGHIGSACRDEDRDKDDIIPMPVKAKQHV